MKKTIFFTAALALLSLGFVDTLQAGIYPGRVTSAPTSNSGRAIWLLSPGAGPFFCDQSGGDCYQDLGGFVWFNDEVAGGNPPPENPSNTGNFAPAN